MPTNDVKGHQQLRRTTTPKKINALAKKQFDADDTVEDADIQPMPSLVAEDDKGSHNGYSLDEQTLQECAEALQDPKVSRRCRGVSRSAFWRA